MPCDRGARARERGIVRCWAETAAVRTTPGPTHTQAHTHTHTTNTHTHKQHTKHTRTQVLLDRGVSQDRVLLLCVVAAPEGVHKVCAAYPALKVVTSEIDHALDESWRVVPGVGEWGNRYFSGD